MNQETNTQPENTKNCEHCNGYCHSHHGGVIGKLFKALLVMVILLLVLMIGVAVGRKSAYITGARWQNGMMQLDFSGPNGTWSKTAMMGRSADASVKTGMMQSNVLRVAGVITAVDGSQITITDNGGSKQTVYSTSSTIINTKTGEVALSSLKAKQFIVCFITVKDGKNIADSIQVTE